MIYCRETIKVSAGSEAGTRASATKGCGAARRCGVVAAVAAPIVKAAPALRPPSVRLPARGAAAREGALRSQCGRPGLLCTQGGRKEGAQERTRKEPVRLSSLALRRPSARSCR